MSNSVGSIGDHPLDDLAAYAVDALDDAERQAVDDHLSRCYACRAELAGHHETLSVLAGDEAPPAAVWQRIAVGIGATDLPDPLGPSTDPASGSGPGSGSGSVDAAKALESSPESEPDPDLGPDPGHAAADTGPEAAPVTSLAEARARRPTRLRWVAAAAGLSAAAAVGAVFGFALGDSGDGRADLSALAEQASDHPDGVLATLDGAGGQPVARVVADDEGAYIVLDGLQNLPEGQAYQLWSLTGPQPVSLGMLGREGTNTVAFRLPPTITSLAISVAPTSGDTTPIGPFQATGPVRRS